ncbi:hypothetical protein D9758_010521 [Tetrapyrgos nigripes]|uniref:BTB domain-containing protein n=1 Tax=Tetrapyrgos nigripes TaxID=182062 RepID=A0A8H5FVP8_9AGAR|nr:hypothetical protein D9758_010521 [Tetrapyrgos nigripes]
MGAQTVPVRDSEYYISEGNTTIRVEGTLFKVHRYILARDGSAFENMFSLDAHVPSFSDSSREGCSDENPIVLHGDTPDEFRALCWSLYALPAEVFQMPSTQSDVIRLIHLARISHKYTFRSTESWALHVLTVCQTSADPSSTDSISASITTTPILTQLTEVAVLCNNEELHEAVEPIWADLLFTGQTDDIVAAMTVADKLNLRPLLGLAYYLMMLKGKDEWNWNGPHKLTRDQRIKLLSGYYNISRACDALPSNPPTLVHHPSCYMPPGVGVQGTAAHTSHVRCGEAWSSLWSGLTLRMLNDGGSALKIQSVDLLRKLHLINHLLESLLNGNEDSAMFGSANMNKNCLRNGLKASEDKVNDVLYGLADCFVE